ncbi:MAG: sigma-54 dependent transcriptional regulator [Longimicrobiales bacterium]|nr:sigma-54 dependent transcriptional regulator [Longimicrobiales bacterium]
MNGRILVVDDEAGLRDALAEKLRYEGYTVSVADSGESALASLSSADPEVVLTDLRMPGLSGIELTERIRAGRPGTDVVVMTGHEDMRSAVGAMKAGAVDYLVKPVRLEAVRALVERVLREQRLEREAPVQRESDDPRPAPGPDEVVGRDPRMIEIFKLIGTLARNRTTVLIRGETGTGKERIARAIHAHSAHAHEPFIAVNCTALSTSLLESELFGHVKGSFTGATSGRRGYFELAGTGTIFLDEIGDTSAEFQSKLLRVLQERTFYPVGGERPRTTDARVVAATHQPLEALVEEGAFREDLYFRLKVVEVNVPALRDRPGDIPLLVDALLARIRRETGQEVDRLDPDARALLEAYDWPGNVRELENALTRAALMARGRTLAAEHLRLGVDRPGGTVAVEASATGEVPHPSPAPAGAAPGAAPTDTDLSLDAAISLHVQRVLMRTGGNKSEAARVLGISRSRLQRYVDRFELDVPGS